MVRHARFADEVVETTYNKGSDTMKALANRHLFFADITEELQRVYDIGTSAARKNLEDLKRYLKG